MRSPVIGGDQENGFSVAVGEAGAQATAWGFWSEDLTNAFSSAMVAACVRCTLLELDATGLKPQRDSCQALLGDMFRRIAGAGVSRVTLRTDNAITKLQLARLFKSHCPQVFVSASSGPRRVA